MKENNLKTGFIIMLILIIILFILFYIGDMIIGGKGANLCSIFFGCIMVILGIFYILCAILLKFFGIKIIAKVLSRNTIRNSFKLRYIITYNIEEKSYTNWVIGKYSNKLNI